MESDRRKSVFVTETSCSVRHSGKKHGNTASGSSFINQLLLRCYIKTECLLYNVPHCNLLCWTCPFPASSPSGLFVLYLNLGQSLSVHKCLNPTATRYNKKYILTYAFKDQYNTGLCVKKAEVGHMRLERSDLLNHQHIN